MPREKRNESADIGADELASLVHDFRGCLHALRMGPELLQQISADQSVKDVCDAMAGEVEKVSQLLDQLLTVVIGRA